MADSRATRISDCLAWFPVAVEMPGSSPLGELTAAVEAVKRILVTLATNVDPTGRQPLQEAEAILAEQLREVRQLFQPNLPTAHEQRVLQPPNTWPRGQQVQPQQQLQPLHKLLKYPPIWGHRACTTTSGHSTTSEGACISNCTTN